MDIQTYLRLILVFRGLNNTHCESCALSGFYAE